MAILTFRCEVRRYWTQKGGMMEEGQALEWHFSLCTGRTNDFEGNSTPYFLPYY